MAIPWTEIGYAFGAMTGGAVFVHTVLLIHKELEDLRKLRFERKRGPIAVPTSEEIERYGRPSRKLESEEHQQGLTALHGFGVFGFLALAMIIRDFWVFVMLFVFLTVLVGYIVLVFLRHLTERARMDKDTHINRNA